MHLCFHSFNHEAKPVAVTGVEGDLTDTLLPFVGDVVRHRDPEGTPFEGTLTKRIYTYDIKRGMAVDGAVVFTLRLDRNVVP